MQVLLGAVLVGAFHAALEHAEVALKRVCVDPAVNRVDPLLSGVVHDAMGGEWSGNSLKAASVIRQDARFTRDVRGNNRANRRDVQVIDDSAVGLASLTVDQG
jgi:hypothetical protein